VSGAHPGGFARAHTAAVESRWQRVEDLIGAGFEPHTNDLLTIKGHLCEKILQYNK